MMKKTLALLLALLLPVMALADASCFEVRVTLDGQNAAEVLRNTGLFADAADEAALYQAFVEMMDGFAVRVVTQEDAGRIVMAFDDASLMELTAIGRADGLIITSDLFDQAGILIPQQALTAQAEAFSGLLQGMDWMELLNGMLIAALPAMEGVEITTQRGAFGGDAYAGGVYCTTYTFDDADIAAILGALLTEDAQAAICAVFSCLGLDGAAFIAEMQAAHAAAAGNNAHRYIVRLVSDAQQTPIGLSAVVMQGAQQLGTLSIGLEDNELVIVAGFGMDDVNYWHCHGIRLTRTTAEDGMETIELAGVIEEFTAPKDEDFAFAMATHDETTYDRDWLLTINLKGSDATWSTEDNETLAGVATVTKEGKGFFIGGSRFSHTVHYSAGGNAYMTERYSWAPCAEIDTAIDGFEIYDLTSGDSAMIDELGMSAISELGMRLLQVIPMELLLMIQ